MHPILFDFGWLRLPTYGTLFALALIAAIYTVIRLGRREGLDAGQLLDFSTWLLIVGLLGSKLLLILTDWSSFGSLSAVFSWNTLQAAGVFYGGFAAATFFAIWYIKVYPTQIIESLATFLIFGILLWRYGKKKYDGQIFVIYLTLYGVARFLIEFIRGDEDRGFVFNHLLSTSQFIAIMAIGVAAVMSWKLGSRARKIREAALPMQPKRARG